MSRFVKSILLFLLPLVALNFIFFSIVYSLYQKPYLENLPRKEFRTFILADSHGVPLHDFLGQKGIYNFSGVSDSYTDMLRKLVYLGRMYKIDTVLITADDHTLSNYRENVNNTDRSIQLVDYQEFKRLDLDMSANEVSYLKEKYIMCYIVLLNSKARSFLLSYFRGFVKPRRVRELSGPDWSKRTDRKRASKKRAQNQLINTTESDYLKDTLLKILKICKDRNVTVIGIKFPLSKDYLDVMGDKGFAADSILQSHQIKILDFEDLFITQDSLFSDQDHLNTLGGEALSREIVERLK